jgi:hypothetical protein
MILRLPILKLESSREHSNPQEDCQDFFKKKFTAVKGQAPE